jgi:hypothetical protein
VRIATPLSPAGIGMLLALGGCSDSATDAATPTSAADAAAPIPLVARCRLTEERPPDPMSAETPVAFSVGPLGTTLFTTQHAWNGLHVPGVTVDVAPMTTDELATVVHTASGDLIADDHGVSLMTWTPVRKRMVFPLPSRGRDATLVETATGPVLLYARVDTASARRNNPDDDEPPGALRWQRLDVNGRPSGAAISLESQDPAFGDVLSFSAHAETGRVVIEVENAEAVTRFGVFDLDGNERSSGEGRDVLCPLAGCVRLVGRIDPRAPQLGGEDGQLRAEILSHGTALSFGLSADHVEAAVVRGNQVFAVLRTGSEGAVTRSLAVLDVPRHRAVPVIRAGTEDTVVSWMISSGATAPMLRVTEDGFAALHTDDTGRLVVQRVACDR